MRLIVVIVLTLALAGALAGPAAASCPGTSGCKTNSGCPPGAAVLSPGGASIQATIDAARSGATICVQPGTYTGKIDFKGQRITLISSGGPSSTILDGGGTGPVVTFSKNEAADSVLDGFTIRNGKAAHGGGIYVKDASPTIRNCILSGNEATGDPYSRGGGIWVGGASAKPVITCTQFLRNRAGYAGGGLFTAYFADPYLRSDHFEGNTASYGGGIAAHWNGRLDIGKSCLVGNQATDGGGIHAGTPYGSVLVRQVCFRDNTAATHGGGMWVPAGLAEVVNSTFNGNRAATGSGLAAGYGGMASVADSLFVNNTTTGGGSAALMKVVSMTATSTAVVNHYNGFFGNTGGAFLNTYGDLGLLSSDPRLVDACCPGAGSPAINAGGPDLHFNDPDGSRNDMGACGGPKIF